ncbi:hypothetical protein KL86PLE_40256 [uncultured Pleomorphomonas sp.]|uniref:Uncharacterized protein n=1 Tax=uncultured Pleomorphomonas sp. TaxID=442121 RepID=A0A212LFW9_9HYPH|nr:hypothetical protein KL86PLE_40256 [uncultured Pleomorphomonas sp.]
MHRSCVTYVNDCNIRAGTYMF